MILAPRSCPSSPGFAMTTRILRATARSLLLVSQDPRNRLRRLAEACLLVRARPAVRPRDEEDDHARDPERERAHAQREEPTLRLGLRIARRRASHAKRPRRRVGHRTSP